MSEKRLALAAAIVFASALAASPAAAGSALGGGTFAAPGGGNTNFAQLKQTSGFTGNLPLSYSDGGYTPVGSSFNKFIKLRFSVDCPAGYRVDKAGIRVRGTDVQNYDFELVSPGDLPASQSSWEEAFEQEPWKFDAVVAVGAAALDEAGNNGPVYVSLDEELDSRTEFYAWCKPSDPLSSASAIYYDSAQDNCHLRPKSRVRYNAQTSTIATSPRLMESATAGSAEPTRPGDRRRARAVLKSQPQSAAPQVKAPTLKAPGGCPYDCPPPAPQRLQLGK